ncbi:MAG: hypothetical protein ACJ76V_04700 [Thermoleophilaceae bacterium]
MSGILDTRTYDAPEAAGTMNAMSEATPIPFARRRSGRRTEERPVARAIEARKSLGTGRGRVWLNGMEVGGTDPRFTHLAGSYD